MDRPERQRMADKGASSVLNAPKTKSEKEGRAETTHGLMLHYSAQL